MSADMVVFNPVGDLTTVSEILGVEIAEVVGGTWANTNILAVATERTELGNSTSPMRGTDAWHADCRPAQHLRS